MFFFSLVWKCILTILPNSTIFLWQENSQQTNVLLILYDGYRMSMIVNELFWVKKGIHLLSKSYVKSWIATDETLILLRFKNMIVIYFSIHKACTSVCPLSFGRIDWFSFDKYTVHILTSFVLFVKYIERIQNKWSIFYLFYLRFSVTLNLPLSNLWILKKKLV